MADGYDFGIPKHPPDYDVATCTHQHTILATAATHDDDTRPVPVTLYHWSPPSVRAIITSVLPPAQFAPLKDYSPLGEFRVKGYVNLSEPLSEVLSAAMTEEEPEATPLTLEVLTGLVARLANAEDDDQGEVLRFFMFSVWGKSGEHLVDGEGSRVAWRWSKPESAYRKSGNWGTDVGKVLEDGEWNAGRGFVLLVKGVRGGGEGELMDL